ncbi:MAG: diguanylate cyclase [Acidobacteriota bacterium]|nr:diguanylate cyclase [Acidobacteriota bacterium]
MEEKILVVDDSKAIRTLVKRKLEDELPMIVETAEDLRSTQELLEGHNRDYLMAVADLNLPDAPNGEVVDYISSKGVPSVVLTGNFDEKVRKKLYSKNIIDYLVKEGHRDLDLIVQTVKRLRSNQDYKILVVDDSRFSRRYVTKLLLRQHYRVVEAENGQDACEVIDREGDINLVITDFDMPEMDGFELIGRLRRKYGKDSIAIIGLSAREDDYLTAKFIKLGANDFLNKPFGIEEFYCRVSQNLELVELIQKIKDASNTDYLTKLFNRRYFFDSGSRNFNRAVKEGKSIALAMFDIDHFKNINDTYGHDGGDLALVEVASLLKRSFRPGDVVARFGGEEFCVLMLDVTALDAHRKLEQIRKDISNMTLHIDGRDFALTTSVGLATEADETLAQLIKTADERLYTAKQTGRNRVVATG